MAATAKVLVVSDSNMLFAAEFYSSKSVWDMNPSFTCACFKVLSQSKGSVLRS